ncbi:MAG: hypothetical protein QOH25_1153 [Acidobacteriota bacterium]|jgi:hypothetical protein|nr:hypothetical protein [Acidobacteriota bacterium]
MDSISFPLPHLSYFAQVLPKSAPGIHRELTGNDEDDRNHHIRVLLNPNPLRLRLSWRNSSADRGQFIGVFDLDLQKLLAANYIRLEPGTQDKARLRFYHGSDDVIYIQANMEGPGLPIGTVD